MRAGSIGALVDNLAQPYNDLGEALWTRAVPAGLLSLPSFSLIFAAALVAIAQFFLFVIGLGMYLLAKVALALVLAVGPAFILCGMFPGTQRYAESWIGQALNFALLADEGHAVADSYGVWVQKSMYGKTYKGNERTTFIIDSDGKVAEVLRKVKPAEHDALVLAALEKLSPPGI